MRKSLASIAVVLAGALAGCAAEDSPSLILASFHGLKAESDGCTATTNPISSGTFDLGIAREWGMPYRAFVKFQNPLAPTGTAAEGRVDTNRIRVENLHVSFVGKDWPKLPEPVTIPVVGVLVDSGGTYTAATRLIAPEVADELARLRPEVGVRSLRLELRIHASGRALDGTQVVSNELAYEVNTCMGCLFAACPGSLMGLCESSYAQGDGVECVVEEAPGGPGGPGGQGGTGGAGGEGGTGGAAGEGGTGGAGGEGGAGGAGAGAVI